jgi:hypothetical protein
VASSAAVGVKDQPKGLARGDEMDSLLVLHALFSSGVFHIGRAQDAQLEGRREKEESDYISNS